MPTRSTISFRVSTQTRKILQARAKESGKTLAAFCQDAVLADQSRARIADLELAVAHIESGLKSVILSLPNNRQMDAMLKILVKEIRAVRTRK